MSRNTLNLTLDLAALMLFVAVVFSGFAMGALHGAPGALLWGMDKRAWVHLHEVGSYLLLLAMGVHLLLHAAWIRVMFCGGEGAGPLRRRGGQILMACAALLLVASVVVPKMLGPEQGPGRPEGRAEGSRR